MKLSVTFPWTSISASCPSFFHIRTPAMCRHVHTSHTCVASHRLPWFSVRSLTLTLLTVHVYRYLDPDPLLLAAPRGRGDETTPANVRFHALNQAIVQLVSLAASFAYAYHRRLDPLVSTGIHFPPIT